MADIARILAEVVLQSKEAITAWKAFGDAGVNEFKRVAAGAAQATANVNASLQRASSSLQQFSARANDVGKSISRIGAGVSAGIGLPLTLAMRKATNETKAAQESMARLEATVAGTGTKVSGTTEEIVAWAGKTQESLAVSDESLLDMVSTLLKFEEINTPKIFDRASDAIIDYAQHTGQDLPAAAQSFGKALADPIRGLRTLREAGLIFNKEQQQQIKTWVESGQTVKAQDLILKEFEKTYGQVAERFAATDTGKATIAANQLSDALEEIGAKLLPLQTRFTEMITAVLDAFLRLPQPLQDVIMWLGVLAIAIGPVITAIGFLVFGIGQVASALAFVVPLFAPLGGVLFTLGTAIGYVINIISVAAGAIAGVGLWPVIVAAALGALIVLIISRWDQIVAFVQKSIAAIGKFFVTMWDGLNAAWDQLMTDWTVVWAEFIDALSLGWDAFVQGIKGTIDSILGWLGGLVQKAKDAWEWIKKAASARSDTAEAGGGGGAFARGGRVRGRGGIDNIAAWLTAGEFVHRVAAVRKYGAGFMHAVNNLSFPATLARGYAVGGMVASPRMAFASSGGRDAAGRSFTLVIDGQSFGGLRAPADTAAEMMAFAQSRKVRSAGRKPSWYS